MWRKLFSAISLAILMLATPAAASFDSDPFLGRGVIRGVDSADRNVLIQNVDGFQILVVDHDATILDAYGAPMTLGDLPLGFEVEYVGRYWEGLTFASSVRVSSRSLPSVHASVR